MHSSSVCTMPCGLFAGHFACSLLCQSSDRGCLSSSYDSISHSALIPSDMWDLCKHKHTVKVRRRCKLKGGE